MEERHIAIVGAGIAGMTLAALLVKLPSPPIVHVFERDKRDRDQGTGFDIHSHGQNVLKKAGVFHKYREFSRNASDIMRFYLLDKPQPVGIFATPKLFRRWIPPTPESNRQLLREALIESVGDKATVKFECKISDIRQNGSQAELLDEDGGVLGIYDLVIDASGFSSILRKYRVANEEDSAKRFEQYYTGLSMVHGLIHDPDRSCPPEVVEKFGQGTMMIFGAGRCLGMQRYGASEEDHRTSVYYMIPCPDIAELCDQFSLPKSTRFVTEQESLQRIKQWMKQDMGDHWPEIYHKTVDNIDTIAIRPLLQHPKNPKFYNDSTLPLILIGDSLHVVPPYTGSGGNLALEDAEDVAAFLESFDNRPIDLAQLRQLEAKLLARAVPVMKKGDSTRDSILNMAKKHQQGIPGRLLDLTGGSYIFLVFVLVFTWLYYLECFLRLRKNNGRND